MPMPSQPLPRRPALPLPALRRRASCSPASSPRAAPATVCGLDYAFADSGDGPAVFIIFVVGFIVVGLAAVDRGAVPPGALRPPDALDPRRHHPLARALRPFKATMIALQYRHDARRGPGQVSTRRWRHRLAFVVLMLGADRRLRRARLLAARAPAREGSPDRRGRPSATIAAADDRCRRVAEWVGFDAEVFDYRPVTVTGTFVPDETVLVFTSLSDASGQFSGPGYWVMTPLVLDAGGIVFVNRGFVPQNLGRNFAAGEGAPARRQSPSPASPAPPRRPRASPPAPTPPSASSGSATSRRLAAFLDPALAPLAPITIDCRAGDPGALPQGGETTIELSQQPLRLCADLVRLRPPHPDPARHLARPAAPAAGKTVILAITGRFH